MSHYTNKKLDYTRTFAYGGNNSVTVKEVHVEEPTRNKEELFVRSANTITKDSLVTLTVNEDGYAVKRETISNEDDKSYLTTYGYQYQNGNLTESSGEMKIDAEIYTQWTTEYKHDDKKSPFYNTKTPKWLMSSYLYDIGLNNNVTESYTIQMRGRPSYLTYAYEYDSEGFPTKQTMEVKYDVASVDILRSETTTFTYQGQTENVSADTEISDADRGRDQDKGEDQDQVHNQEQAEEQAAEDTDEFIPAGYVLLSRMQGVLDQEGLTYDLLVVKGTNKDSLIACEYADGGKEDHNRRGIIIVFNESDGSRRRVIENLSCFPPERYAGGGYSFGLSFTIGGSATRNSLFISHDIGDWGISKYNFRPQDYDFELIGYDRTMAMPRFGSSVSINFLSKKMQTKRREVEDGEGNTEVIPEHWDDFTLAKPIRLSEITDFNDFNLVEMVEGLINK
jgi:hypothetical protein